MDWILAPKVSHLFSLGGFFFCGCEERIIYEMTLFVLGIGKRCAVDWKFISWYVFQSDIENVLLNNEI